MQPPRKAIVCVWITATLFFLILIGVAVFPRVPQFHPYVVFQASDVLKIAFLRDAQSTRSQCETMATRMVQTMLARCSVCRLLEKRCLE